MIGIDGRCYKCGIKVESSGGCACQWPPVINQMRAKDQFIEATPDGKYALRILEYYRQRCNERWATDTAGNCDNPVWKLMNEAQEKRAMELDQAINSLLMYDSFNTKKFVYGNSDTNETQTGKSE